MSSHTRIILGFLGLVTAGLAVRALQTGIFYGRDFRPWDRNKKHLKSQYRTDCKIGVHFCRTP